MRLPRTALAPVVSLGLVAFFLFLSGLSAFLSTAHGQTSDGHSEGEAGTSNRFVARRTIYGVGAGDHVELSAQWGNGMDEAAPHARILVVEGGEGEAYFAGGEAEHILAETRYPEASGPITRYTDHVYGPLLFRFERPEIYLGKPHAEGLNGDLHDAIDVVFVYERPPGMAQATWDESRSAVYQSAQGMDYDVAREPWVSLQWVWLPGAAIAAAATVVTTLTWLRGARLHQAGPDQSLEALVEIQGRALGYLRSLRNTMRCAGALLVFGGLASLVALNDLASSASYRPWRAWGGPGVAPWEDWTVFMGLAGFLTLGAAIAVWVIQYRRISREVKRWQATPSPLDA